MGNPPTPTAPAPDRGMNEREKAAGTRQKDKVVVHVYEAVAGRYTEIKEKKKNEKKKKTPKKKKGRTEKNDDIYIFLNEKEI